MTRAPTRTHIVALLSGALVALPAVAQQPAPPPAAAALAAAAQPDVFSIEQLDALLAPIALYPDALLAPMLMAASDPVHVVIAARWAALPEHAALTGDALASALAAQDWDPDIKALAAVPAALRLLDDNLEWSVQLGYAVANQPAGVLDSLQRLRRQAERTGTLGAGLPLAVRRAGGTLLIDPAGSAALAIPVYDSAAAYGPWPYAAFPPVHLAAAATPGAPAELPPGLRDLCGLGWSSGEVILNVAHWNAANGDRPPIAGSVWHPHPALVLADSAGIGAGARPLPPSGPVGRPAAPTGIPANAIGRQIVTVAAELVRHPTVAPAHAAALPPGPLHATPHANPLTATAQPAAMKLAPLPAHLETARPNALSDVNVGMQAALFGARGAESRSPLAAPHHQDVAGLTQ